MHPLAFIRSVIGDFRAWRRGERRIAPRGCRGRIYEKRNAPPGEIAGGAAGAHHVRLETTFQTAARVIRADGSPDEFHNLTTGKVITEAEHAALTGRNSDG